MTPIAEQRRTMRQKPEFLSDYFRSVYITEDSAHDISLEERDVDYPDIDVTTDEDEVRKLLKELKVDKSPGPDGIHPLLLSKLADSLAGPLSRLYNLTFTLSSIPEEWKLGRICAIHKKGDTRLASNYRPVSLTSVIGKVGERIIRKRVMHHLSVNRLLTQNQYGFIPGRNIQLQLLRIVDDWTEAWDQRHELDCVYLDFSKAFDRVPHKRLLMKLESLGINRNTILWIKDFLTNRVQEVRVGEATSERIAVTSGIPQGSVLGPLLFVMFINDLPECVVNKLLLFADDTKIYNHDDLFSLQADLDRLSEWSDKWLLSFNSDKCKHLHVGRRDADTGLKLGNHDLMQVTSEKDLGVIFEDTLTFTKHIAEKTKKANSMFGIIRRSFRHLNCKTFIPLYKGMVRCHLDFCASVYSPRLRSDVEKLESVQRRATKQLPELSNMSYEERLKKLELPTLSYRRQRGDMIELYKATQQIYESELCTFIKPRTQETIRHTTRHHNKTIFPTHSNSNIRKHSFNNRNAIIWNSLPSTIVNAPSLNAFKNRLDNFWKNQDLKFNHTATINPRMPQQNQIPQEDF